jgi:hypothetical protein
MHRSPSTSLDFTFNTRPYAAHNCGPVRPLHRGAARGHPLPRFRYIWSCARMARAWTFSRKDSTSTPRFSHPSWKATRTPVLALGTWQSVQCHAHYLGSHSIRAGPCAMMSVRRGQLQCRHRQLGRRADSAISARSAIRAPSVSCLQDCPPAPTAGPCPTMT